MADVDREIDLLDFEHRLQKIRLQGTSKLANQKHLALVLSAVEENITAQENSKSPVAYFVSFLALLEQSIDTRTDEITDGALAITASYFLDLVLPFIPRSLLKQKFSDILTRLAPAITSSSAEAPLIRSSIGALETLLIAQDINSWNNTASNITPRRGLSGLLEFSLDPRPKVRKRAQEAIHKVLSNPPPGPALEHVASGMCAEFAEKNIVELLNTKTNQKNNKEHNAQLIHSLQLISSITSANTWPSSKIGNLCEILLEITKSNDQYLVSAAFNGFEGLFNSMNDEVDHDKFVEVLNTIFDLKPSINDTHLSAPWIAVIAKGISSYAKVEPLEAVKRIPQVFKILTPFFSSESKDIYESASNCMLSIISEAIPDEFLLAPSQSNNITQEIYEQFDDIITQIAEVLTQLLDVKYGQATNEILTVFNAALEKLRSRANPDFLEPLKIIGEWLDNGNFQFQETAENVIVTAFTELTPETVFGVLPLNMFDSKKEGRGWMIGLLSKADIHLTRLAFFPQEVFPIIEKLTGLVEKLDNNTTTSMELQAILSQLWSSLPRFANLPNDLQTAFNDEFAQQLSSLLYSNPELRPDICNAFKILVDSNVHFANGDLSEDQLLSQEFSIDEAKQNVEYLSTKASNILAVLFNVFTQTSPDSRGYILETIDTYLGIAQQDDLKVTFDKVSVLLKNAFDEEAKNKNKKQDKNVGKLSATLMDLIVEMAKYVPESCYMALFTIFNQTVSSEDPLLQKRAYRIISKLIETPSGKLALTSFVSEIENVIIKSIDTVHLSARAARINAIRTLLQILPQDHLYFIPALLSELILATKDTKQKTREEAFDCLLDMANVMAKGGVIQNSKIPGFDESMPDSEASLNEFFTMLSAGLAGGDQHMVSATIGAVAYVVYSFKDEVTNDLLLELTSTVNLFLTSNSKEIARAAIGFVKTFTMKLPEEIVRPQLKELIPHLMRWSHEHTGRFKSKVKLIVEVMIKKFGFDTVESLFPEEDTKLLANIRKTKAREKRKLTEARENGEVDTAIGGARKFDNVRDEILYGSESEESDEEEDDNDKKSKKSTQFILESKDEPLDLMDRQALSHISSSKPTNKKVKRSNASEFEKDGKLYFADETDKDEYPLKSMESGINAYVEAVKSGPVKGQKNKFKFKRGAKASKEDDDDFQDELQELARPARHERAKVSKGNKVGKPKLKARKKF